jgi:hypothetical protein
LLFASLSIVAVLPFLLPSFIIYGLNEEGDTIRLWRTVKYEDIYLQGYENLRSLKRGLESYFRFYNQYRFHQNLDYETPDQRYESFKIQEMAG